MMHSNGNGQTVHGVDGKATEVASPGYEDRATGGRIDKGDRFEIKLHLFLCVHADADRVVLYNRAVRRTAFKVGETLVVRGITMRVEGVGDDFLALHAPRA